MYKPHFAYNLCAMITYIRSPWRNGNGIFFFYFQLEPEANGTEILNALKYVRPGDGFVPNFQMFKMVDVNGKNEIPLYTYMKVRYNF